MIRNRNRCRAGINGATRVVAGQDPFDHDRTAPAVADPPQVGLRHRGAGERGIDIDERHGSLAGNDHVGEGRQAPVQ